MEANFFLRMLNRKAVFSVAYLLIAVAFAYAYFYLWHFHEFDYARNAESPVSALNRMLDPCVGFLVIVTVIFYLGHFIGGSFLYPERYKCDLEKDIDLSDPEYQKDQDDSSGRRGLLICIVWALIFCLAFYNVLPALTVIAIVTSWILLHVFLIKLTSTAGLFKLVVQTVDLTIIMPKEYPEDCRGHICKKLYFFIPSAVDESAWTEAYIRAYVDYIRELIAEKKENEKKTKDDEKKAEELSKKLAKS